MNVLHKNNMGKIFCGKLVWGEMQREVNGCHLELPAL